MMRQPTQLQIEQMAGITPEVAKHMMKLETPAAKNAMSLLKMCCDFFEECAMTLLKEAVRDCKSELEKE